MQLINAPVQVDMMNAPKWCLRLHTSLSTYLIMAVRFNRDASLIALRDVVPFSFFFHFHIAQCSFLIYRSFPVEIHISFFPPSFHFSLSHFISAPGCSLHVVAQTRWLSISIRNSCRLLCNLSPADIVTWSERIPYPSCQSWTSRASFMHVLRSQTAFWTCIISNIPENRRFIVQKIIIRNVPRNPCAIYLFYFTWISFTHFLKLYIYTNVL